MAKRISPSNAVVSSCEEAASLYGIPAYRMNSRVFSVVGAGGRTRPMFIGKWKDRFGVEHNGGMTDLLLTPKIMLLGPIDPVFCVVPLWVECKFGSGRLEPEQKLFREDVLERGAFYLEIHDGPDALIEWFKMKGVRR
jgi:hypothetical protein